MALHGLPLGRQPKVNRQLKPWGIRGQYELDYGAPLAAGLVSAMVLDGPAGPGGIFDYASTERTFSTSGTVNFSSGQFGNQVNAGFNTTAAINFTPTFSVNTTACAFSFMIQLDGSDHGALGLVLLSDGVAGHEVLSTQTGTGNPLLYGNGAGVAQSNVLLLGQISGWHRVGASISGTNCRFFLDGKFQDQVTVGGVVTSGLCSQLLSDVGDGSFSWGWNIADMFIWNRALSDLDIEQHWLSPYRSVLRPKFSMENLVGATKRTKPSLMLQGIGP